MNSKNCQLCFNVNNLNQALEALSVKKTNKKVTFFYIKYFLIDRFGLDWIIEFRNLLLKKYNRKQFEFVIDCKKNYALFIYLVQKKFNYLCINADKRTLLRLKNIAKKNNVTVNPKISIINLSNIKNIKKIINDIE